ncbi:hypothetical protein NC652_032588 [Populus alba x Populus x berolinensis]|nr:hypothetical protein NC652_032588 [Populus alba x Populus x berolinensis]
MAKRKSRSNSRPVKKPKLKLDTVFRCPFCQLENTVGCSFDKDLNIGEISCSICHAGYDTKLTPLTEPIDIYCEWIDECERKSNQHQKARFTFFQFQILMEEEPGNPRRSSEESTTPFLSLNDGLIPQLFTSVPSLNEAASYLAQSTSLFTRCFSDYSAFGICSGPLELTMFSSTQNGALLDSDRSSSSGSHSATDTPPIHSGVTINSSEGPSQNTSALVQSNNSGQSGLSMFQGLIERARRTVRGSADDIGWLQHASGMPSVEDGTGRFMEILDNIRHGLHKLPNSIVYLLVPGSNFYVE